MPEEKTAEELKKAKQVHVVNVTRYGDKIILPANPRPMTNSEAIEVLKMREAYDQEKVQLDEFMPGFIWDAALAFHKAMKEIFGEAFQRETKTFFGKVPPAMIQIECGLGETVSVPWGQFELPGIKGQLSTGHGHKDGRVAFRAIAVITHEHEQIVKRLFARTRELAATESIYKGQAIHMAFTDRDGDPLPIPTVSFMDLKPQVSVYNDDIERELEVSILTPIRHTQAVKDHGIPIKRTALLAGVYGTGKSLAANMAAREAVKHGWTFVYVPGTDLLEALKFAKFYQPAVVFAEDIDRIAGSERTETVNELLNHMSGILTYSDDIMAILTSNFPERINEAMRRPGRLDLILEIEKPNAKAVARLLHVYGAGKIRKDEDLSEVGEMLSGHIPAVIREVLERSKLAALSRTHGQSVELTAEDLMVTATRLKKEQDLFRIKVEGRHYGHEFVESLEHQMESRVKKVMDRAVERIVNGN